MITVGIRPPEEVFSPPEEPIAKLPSTNVGNPEMILNGIDKNGVAHINRIVLSRTADVKLLRVESPSRIWVRLQNHITDTLTFNEPFKLEKLENFIVNDYAIAPNDERSFRRCRIIEIEGDLVKVFFIDDAVVAWVHKDCMAKMDEHYMYFPWQAIQVSMFGIYPEMENTGSSVQVWSKETCDELRIILREFNLLQVDVQLSSVVFNDYAKPIAVNLHGIKNEEATEGHPRTTVSIAAVLSENLPCGVIYLPMFDAAVHEVFETSGDKLGPTEPIDIHRSFPVDWKHQSISDEDAKEEAEKNLFTNELEHRDWDPRQNRVPMLTVEALEQKFLFPSKDGIKQVMFAVEGKCTKSPYEWYARPIIKTLKNSQDQLVPWDANQTAETLRETDQVDWMIYGNDQLMSVAEQLDTYYSNPKNRKPLKKEEIESMMSTGFEVYAVCAVTEEKAMYTGEWQRVLVLNCENFADVRFLDSGGRDMVLTSSLYRIHSQHCRFPAMCVRFAMHGVSTKINKLRADKKWNVKETSLFKICLREDVPIFINLKDLNVLIPPDPHDHRPFMVKNGLLARDVRYLNEPLSLLDNFVGETPGCAEISPNDPVVWPQ